MARFGYHFPMPIYECPRCRGNDVYFGYRQEIRWTRGAYPEQYLAEVQKAICRQCGEPMNNLGPTKEEAKAAEDARQANLDFWFSKAGLLVVSAALLIVGLVVWGIWSVVTEVVQCFDGSNYERNEAGGVVNTC